MAVGPRVEADGDGQGAEHDEEVHEARVHERVGHLEVLEEDGPLPRAERRDDAVQAVVWCGVTGGLGGVVWFMGMSEPDGGVTTPRSRSTSSVGYARTPI